MYVELIFSENEKPLLSCSMFCPNCCKEFIPNDKFNDFNTGANIRMVLFKCSSCKVTIKLNK